MVRYDHGYHHIMGEGRVIESFWLICFILNSSVYLFQVSMIALMSKVMNGAMEVLWHTLHGPGSDQLIFKGIKIVYIIGLVLVCGMMKIVPGN